MEDTDDMKSVIIAELGANYNDDEAIIEELIDEYMSIASDFTNRTDTKLYPYVKKAVISAYMARGAEGFTSRNEGSISNTFNDIEKKLKIDLVSLRRLV